MAGRSRVSNVTPEKKFNVSQSKIKTWLRCRRAYWYRYVEKLRRKKLARPLAFGRLVHQMIETEANGGDPFDKLREIDLEAHNLFASQREEYGEIIADVSCIMQEYFAYDWGTKKIRYIRRNKKASEHEFNVEIAPGIMLNGKIDNFAVRVSNDMKYIVDHKSFKSLPEEDERWRNLQAVTYFRANEMLGWPTVDGICWNYIRSKPPTAPKLLQSGDLSRRGLDTLPSKIIATLKEHKQDPKKFATMIRHAEKNRSNYFMRVFVSAKPKVVDAMFADVVETSVEMRDLHGKVKARHIGRHCSWCDYEGICRAELQGSDFEFVKKKDYYVSERGQNEWEVHVEE